MPNQDADNNNQNLNGRNSPLRDMRPKTGDALVDGINDIIDILESQQGTNFARRVQAPRESQSNFASKDSKWSFTRPEKNNYRRTGSILDDFENGIRDQLLDSIAGGDFKKNMQNALNTFTKEFGVDIRDLPHEAGKALTQQAVKSFRNSKAGQAFEKKAKEVGNDLLNNIFGNVENGGATIDALRKVGKSFLGEGGEVGNLANSILGSSGTGLADALGPELGGLLGGGEMTAAMSGLTNAAMGAAVALSPELEIAIAAVAVAALLAGPALEGLSAVAETAGKSFMKSEEIRQKRAEQGQKRLQETVEDMARKPFEILEEATKEWTSKWDANLRTVGQTQGYDKEAVYALYEGYANRLREDNLASVINATDIVDKLSSVLNTGLSGDVAEQFAYIATKLNAAIPTQDFFGYAESYASIAANAIAQGKSQEEALAEANAQLEQFASNLLYSSRELAGGFSTGLKDSASLFKDAVQIAQTAKTYNASDISGTLTSVSAIIGSVAPDLANSLVDNVVQAAIGGNNNSSLVALRSLAGINAGNTEFLRAMAENPQSVFSAIFSNLAQMQSMSPDNYMEVAEGLADVFGIDKAALARVDFNYLAQAIDSMDVNNKSLQENMDLLVSGQTTTSAEQLKAQEINRVILDEGLAYVIDSEAGRMIQEHMWQEQIANQIQENSYAVELQGSALKFLEGIRETITNIMNFINPIGFIGNGVANLIAVTAESIGNQDDIMEVLQRGAVGNNANSLYNLTTVGKDLNLVTSLVEMMGGRKGNDLANLAAFTTTTLNPMLAMGKLSGGEAWNTMTEASTKFYTTTLMSEAMFAKDLVDGAVDVLTGNTAKSKYSWGTVGKSIYEAVQSTPMNTNVLGAVASAVSNATQNALENSNKKFQEFLNSAEEASKTMSYDAWVATAKNFGISDFADALSNYGRSEEEIAGYFQANQAREGALQEVARKEDEQLFRDENRGFWDYTSGTGGIFHTAIWEPFFGEGQKYDSRMDSVDTALSNIQLRIGATEKHTVIGGIEELSYKLGEVTNYTVIGVLEQIHTDISNTFVTSSSIFQTCLKDWIRYIAASKDYTSTVSKSTAWSDFKAAEADQQTQATLALANALGVFSADELKKMDPQLQTNALLGEIVIILQAIMQQNNTTGGVGFIESLSALGMGITTTTQ